MLFDFDAMSSFGSSFLFDLLISLIEQRAFIFFFIICAWLIKRFVWDIEVVNCPANNQERHQLEEKEITDDLKNHNHVDKTKHSVSGPRVEIDSVETDALVVCEQDDGTKDSMDSDSLESFKYDLTKKLCQNNLSRPYQSTNDLSFSSSTLKSKSLTTIETQTSIDSETPNISVKDALSVSDFRPRYSTEDIRSRLQRPSCRCRRPAKSASMSEADVKKRSAVKNDGKPVSVTYYYGKLIQVNSSNQVQIGDCNTMELNLSQKQPEPGEDEEEKSEVILDEDEEEESGGLECGNSITHLCSECRSRLTDDEKSLLENQADLFSDNESQTDLLEDDPSQEDISFDLSSQISCDVSDVTTSTACLYSSEDELDEPMSPARRLRSRTNPASDEEKEQIYVEARIKIYKAAAEHRRNITSGHVPSHSGRRFSDILKRKKTVSQ